MTFSVPGLSGEVLAIEVSADSIDWLEFYCNMLSDQMIERGLLVISYKYDEIGHG